MQLLKKTTFWLALAGTVASAVLVMKLRANLVEPVSPPPIAPAKKPFAQCLGSAGLVEARRENTFVGVPAPGLITEIRVHVWDKVTAGQPLFSIDSRDLQAALAPQKAQVVVAEASLKRLMDQLSRLEAVSDPRAISTEEIRLRRSDIEVAKAQLIAASAAVSQTENLIDRLVVRAPIDGTILQVNIRAGEYASPAALTAPIILGNIDDMQVRADVDEQLAPRVRSGAKAVACIKGDSLNPIDLEFVRIEPFIIPKRSLTGASLERVDTRVLQVIFRFKASTSRPIYVGQQMDVYIEE